MKNFAITGMARTGTKFLANTMDLSPTWTVTHEGGEKWIELRKSAQAIQKRFGRDYVGDVSNYTRFAIADLDVRRKGVILRSPKEIWISLDAKRKSAYGGKAPASKRAQDFRRFREAIPHVLNLARRPDILAIDFKRMTSDVAYLQGIFDYFGIDDVTITQSMVDVPINNAPGVERVTLKSFGEAIRTEVRRLEMMHRNAVKAIWK